MEYTIPDLKPRQLVIGSVGVVLVGLGFWLLFRFHEVVIVFFAAVVISAAIKPIVSRLYELGLPQPLGVIVVYILLLILIAGFLWFLAPLTFNEGAAIVQEMPERYTELREGMLRNPNFFIWRVAYELPEKLPLSLDALPSAAGGGEAAESVTQDLNFIVLVAKALFAIVATFVLAFYWIIDGQRTIKSLTLLFPVSRREGVRQFLTEAESKIEAFVVGQLILSFVIGSLSLVVFLLVGLPNAFLLAVVAGLFEALPLIGPVLGAIPAALVALSISPTKAIIVVAAMTVIQQLENQFLVPRIMKRSVGLNPLVTLLGLLSFGLLFGIPGALVAIPLLAVIQLLLDRTVLTPSAHDPQSLPGRDQSSVLQYEVQELVSDLRRHIRHKDSDPSSDDDYVEDSIEAIAADLESLLALSASQKPAGERK